MKWGIVVFLAVLLAMPMAFAGDVIFTNLKGSCNSDGSALVSMIHDGSPIKESDIEITSNFTETDAISNVDGRWLTGGENQAYIYYSPSQVLFNSSPGQFSKKGEYEIHFLFFQKSQDYAKTDVSLRISCPGMPCNNNYECDFDSECSDGLCQPLNCRSNEFIEFHQCTPKCNDFKPCTIDRYESGRCVYSRNDSCCGEDKDCSSGSACIVDKCANGQCVHSPIVCESAKDSCVTSKCVETKGCIYETDESCLANENEKRDYLIVIGQPKVYTQPLLPRIFSAIGDFFRNLF